MALEQFISKLSLESRICSILFFGGIFLKLIAIISFSSIYTNDYFLPFIDYFINSDFSNPYKYFASQPVETFPYPALMLYVLTIPKILFAWISSSVQFSILLLKLPVLFADIAIFYVLKSWLNHKNVLSLILLYWFSPVLIYISYINGQLDAIPIAFLLISFYFLLRNSLGLSAIFLACSMAAKTVIAVIIPLLLIFFFSQRLPILTICKYFLIFIASFFLINANFIFDEYFFSMVFNNQQQSKVFLSAIDFGPSTLYLLPIAYLGILLKGLSLNTLNKDIFVMFLGFSFAIFLIFTHPSPGWYYWLLPFLFYFFAKSSSKELMMVLLLQIAFLLYFLLDKNVNFIIYKGNFLSVSIPFIDYFQQHLSIDRSLLINLSFTFLQSLLIFNCYWIYIYGLNQYSQHKITSIPFLIGVGGDSGSGKTLLSDSLAEVFGYNKSSQLHGDDLHRWERNSDNWSLHTHLDPKANMLHHEPQILQDLLNGKVIYRQKYNHDTGKFNKPSVVTAANFLIYEGLHPFFLERQRDLFDLKIFLNPKSDLRSSWKILRDTKLRGKSEKEVKEQIDYRMQDSKSYIQSQLKFADIIIEPFIEEEFNGQQPEDLNYQIILANSFAVDAIIEIFSRVPGLNLKHEFISNSKQSIIVKGTITALELEMLAYEFIEDLQELGISKPIWPSNAFGTIIFIITYIIFKEAEYARRY